MSLRTNLTLATIAALGFATVCAVCSAQLDREPPRPLLVAAVKSVPLEDPVTTGSIVPTLPAARAARLARVEPKPEPKKEARPKPEPALDSERLAALLAEPTVMKPKR
ncbi:hypothetical protein [Methylobacterium nonmethylotrophicum]|uniref:Uncharacterized protein n=1 Tax=Methylobacterium nonmethylotrophicum TaxID=1141884 RepID=A0A4Z0NVQ4_9HYPH|nr:hypothetical protein [Methylobacterium nonmethylotrophicum]TGE01791.1 hypothetical protein EU555_03720 [Methylobacterium nonmethylotrophicum]